MVGRTAAKPYFKALTNYPKHKEELDSLPPKYYEVIARYPYSKAIYLMDEEDFFENLVLYCMEADRVVSGGSFYSRALYIAEAALHEQRQEFSRLYNPYRNLYLDKCYGESKTPLGEWMNFSEDEDN